MIQSNPTKSDVKVDISNESVADIYPHNPQFLNHLKDRFPKAEIKIGLNSPTYFRSYIESELASAFPNSILKSSHFKLGSKSLRTSSSTEDPYYKKCVDLFLTLEISTNAVPLNSPEVIRELAAVKNLLTNPWAPQGVLTNSSLTLFNYHELPNNDGFVVSYIFSNLNKTTGRLQESKDVVLNVWVIGKLIASEPFTRRVGSIHSKYEVLGRPYEISKHILSYVGIDANTNGSLQLNLISSCGKHGRKLSLGKSGLILNASGLFQKSLEHGISSITGVYTSLAAKFYWASYDMLGLDINSIRTVPPKKFPKEVHPEVIKFQEWLRTNNTGYRFTGKDLKSAQRFFHNKLGKTEPFITYVKEWSKEISLKDREEDLKTEWGISDIKTISPDQLENLCYKSRIGQALGF